MAELHRRELLGAALATGVSLGAGPAPALADPWEGVWTGVSRQQAGAFRASSLVKLEFRRQGAAHVAIDHDRQSPGEPGPMQVEGRRAKFAVGQLFGGTLSGVALLAEDGESLELTTSGGGMTGLEGDRLILRRDDPAARAFAAPRLEAAYRYQPPAQRDDGIPTSSLAAEGLDPSHFEALVGEVSSESGDPVRRQTESILVMRNGKLVFEAYFWGQSADDAHLISSCTKSLCSTLAGLAVDDGKLDVDARVTDYFPDRADVLWAREAWPIKVRHLLSMTSGTAWDDTTGQPSTLLLQSQDVAGYVLNLPLVKPPEASTTTTTACRA